MKIAVLLTGNLRNYKKTFPYLQKNLLNHYDVDIFFSGYPNKEGKSASLAGLKKLYNPTQFDLLTPLDVEKSVRSFHNVGAYEKHKRPETNIIGVLSHFYHMKNCFSMISNESTYDIIICMRPDLYFINKLEQLDLELLKNRNVYFAPNIWDFKEVHPFGISLGFIVSSYFNMKKYCNLFSDCQKYFQQGLFFHPETMNGKHLLELGLEREIKNELIMFYEPGTKNYNERYQY